MRYYRDLKVDVVEVNADIYRRIGIAQPSVPELLRMTNGDKETWSMYAKGYTMGLNQAEKEKSTQKVMTYKPQNISELTAFVAAIRPGFQSMIDKFLSRTKFAYNIPALDHLLQTKEMPDSFIIYQQQVMGILQYGGFAASESYAAIKAIAKKHPEKVLPLKSRFLENFSGRLINDQGLSVEEANNNALTVWKIIEDNTSYSFNCVSGDTVILRDASKKNAWKPTIAEMYRTMHDPKWSNQNGHRDLHKKYVRYGYGKAQSLCEDGRIRQNAILDIVDSGQQNVYVITTAGGRTIKATAGHKFPIGSYDNMVELCNLKIGDNLFVRGAYEKNTNKYLLGGRGNLPQKGQMGFQTLQDGNLYHKTRDRYAEQKRPCECCGLQFSEDVRFELHHIDNDRTHNKLNNYAWLCVSCHKKAHYDIGRVARYQKGIPSDVDTIVSIELHGKEHVYDVVMDGAYHNFVIDNGLVVGNCSHALSVALDSLYTAWAKAHHPYETYVALLSNYAEKGDKERIDKCKQEMKKAFGITVAPCKFRQDNRSYFVDKEAQTIADSLTSIKGVGKKDAQALLKLADGFYPTFVDLLYDMTNYAGAVNGGVIETLIKMDYFEEFGTAGKLMKVYNEFKDGKNKYTKSLVESSVNKRLNLLRDFEMNAAEEELPMKDIIKFEVEKFGTPFHTFPTAKDCYAVLDVDEKFTPKIRLYSLTTGSIGVMKVKKALYKPRPVQPGDIIHIADWKKKQSYTYKDGKSQPNPGVYDLWIDSYMVTSKLVNEF